MTMFTRTHVRLIAATATSMMLGGYLAGHGNYVKTIFNVVETANAASTAATPRWDLKTSKANGSTRGAATTQPTTLYLMDPPLNHTGQLDAQGWRIVVQDEEASTLDNQFEMSYVKYAPNGTDPDTGPLGKLHSFRFWFFFGSLSGRQSMEFEITFGVPLKITEENHGIAVTLPDAPNWPADGISVHGQLNLANDPLRPRVPAPYDQQVWSYEAPAPLGIATPLGGRTADTLQFGTLWAIDPTLQTFIVSNAYGQTEELYGAESMHPDASRGDKLGFFVQGGNDGASGTAFLFGAPALRSTPLQFGPAAGNSPQIWLDTTTPYPLLFQMGTPDPATSQLRLPPIDFSLFPVGMRDWWFQALLFYPTNPQLIQLTDATGVQGL